MRAAWYDRTGPARTVLTLGELPDPEPGPGEVRVRVVAAGINPADVKRRGGLGGRAMQHPRVIPGDDGAGVVEALGDGVPAERLGRRVWVHAANHGRAFGTSADRVVVPSEQAVDLPPDVDFDVGACLGVPALTAHRSVFADGPVTGSTVLVTGGAGAVGSYAVQLAKLAGATVLATASAPEKRRAAAQAGAEHVVDYRRDDAAARILELTSGRGVDRVVDVAFGANLPLTSRVIAADGTIAAYGSDAVPEPPLPFYTLMRRGVTVRTVSVFTMPAEARRAAISEVSTLVADGRLRHRIAERFALEDVVGAHEAVEAGRLPGQAVLRIDA